MGIILVLITLVVVLNLIRSRAGRAISAIRDNEIAAKSIGINITRYKLKAFVLSSVFDGMAGFLRRALLWMRIHRLEWAYRLYLQPSRIGRMAAIPKFMLAIKKWKRKNGNKIC